MKINIETIKFESMRYKTVGDWWFDENGDLQIRVADMGNKYYEWFVAEHEINEALLCEKEGISEKSVSDYDIAFEALREKNPELIGDQEPGDMIAAPYNKAHKKATEIEFMTCALLGESWSEYDKSVNDL